MRKIKKNSQISIPRPVLDERELSKLSYLAQALVSAPIRFKELIEIARSERIPGRSPNLRNQSRSFQIAIAALENEFSSYFKKHTSKHVRHPETAMKNIAERLIDAGGPAREAGIALHWALKNYRPWYTGSVHSSPRWFVSNSYWKDVSKRSSSLRHKKSLNSFVKASRHL